jgi:hypothetical protein
MDSRGYVWTRRGLWVPFRIMPLVLMYVATQ